jgi:protein-S-isoprenylcysteine O-methyltransferase Ste14
MTRFDRLFVWVGGALFVASLAVCAYQYFFVWGSSDDVHPDAVAVNALLFGLFAMHHSVFARERVKARVARLVPDRLLRSVYVWTASALLLLVCALWRPVGGEVYRVTGWRALTHALVQLGGLWLIAASVRAIDPLELAGIRPQAPRDTLQITGPYRWVRHPVYLGWMLASFGAAHMTGNRLAFAAITSIYLLVAVPWEERSLRQSFGEDYAEYKRRVKWRIVPFVY